MSTHFFCFVLSVRPFCFNQMIFDYHCSNQLPQPFAARCTQSVLSHSIHFILSHFTDNWCSCNHFRVWNTLSIAPGPASAFDHIRTTHALLLYLCQTRLSSLSEWSLNQRSKSSALTQCSGVAVSSTVCSAICSLLIRWRWLHLLKP